MTKHACLLASLALCCCFARAADIYIWTDEQGRTQMSDVVPDKYRATARKLDSRQFNLTPQQKAEADARAARERTAASRSPMPAGSDLGKAPAGAPTNLGGVSRAASGAMARPGTDCASLQRAYAESQACFAPYVTAKGAVKAEAYQTCTSIPDPSPKCGTPPDQ
jgi:hypothetical protein